MYILTHPGTPTIFWDHLFEWEDDPGLSAAIEKLITFRKERGVHSRSNVRILKAEQSVYAAQIDESLVMKIGPGRRSRPARTTGSTTRTGTSGASGGEGGRENG